MIILDVSPVQRIVKNGPKVLTQILDSTIVFANSHLMQTPSNSLAIMACHSLAAEFLYPEEHSKISDIRQIDGQYEIFTYVEKTVRQRLQKLINSAPVEKITTSESLISGALSKALCYIGRLDREKQMGEKIKSRILVITGGNDAATQYMNYMNIFFTAQKMVLLELLQYFVIYHLGLLNYT